METVPRPHTAESIRCAAQEFLALLDQHDVQAEDGYYVGKPARSYFAALYEGQPGVWEATIRNITYGLDHFAPGLVVDMGCGHGLQSFVFASHGRAVLGVDSDAHIIGVANRVAAAKGLDHLTFRVGNARTEMARLSAGAVWHHRSLHHVPERTDFDRTALAYFRAVHTALHPGGSLVFMTSNSTSRSLLPGVRAGQHDARHLTSLLHQAGFRIGDLSYQGFLSGVPSRYRPKRTPQIERALSRIPGVRALGGSFSMAAYAE